MCNVQKMCRHCPAPAPAPPCPVVDAHRAKCNYIQDSTDSVFGACVSALGSTVTGAMFADCLLDACNTNGSSLCLSLRPMVDECAQIGQPIECGAWQTKTGCGQFNCYTNLQ